MWGMEKLYLKNKTKRMSCLVHFRGAGLFGFLRFLTVFLFLKEVSVDSRLSSFESQMSVQWKLKVDRQMESVRSPARCQNRRRCPR